MKKLKKYIKKNKNVIIPITIALAIILFVSGAKLALYVNFLIGNDIVVSLKADNESLKIVHGQIQNVTFESSVSTNPFCTADCISNFVDISQDRVIQTDEFTLRPLLPLEKAFSLAADNLGEGIDLYRFNLSCKSKRTVMCHTDENPTTRSILVTVNYGLNEDETAFKQFIHANLRNFAEKLSKAEGDLNAIDGTVNNINQRVSENLSQESLRQDVADFRKNVESAKAFWDKQDFDSLKNLKIDDSVVEEINSFNEKIEGIILRYNALLKNLNESREKVLQLNGLTTTSKTAELINSTVIQFNNNVDLFNQIKPLNEFANLSVDSQINEINDQLKKDNLEKEADLLIANEVVCLETGLCNSSVSDDLNMNCAALNNMSINSTLPRKNVTQSLLSKSNLSQEKIDYLISSQEDELVRKCSLVNVNTTVAEIKEELIFEESIPAQKIIFPEPKPQCCVFGKCGSCCVENTCKKNPETYPVMLLHGHLFSEGNTAEYSLESLTGIQSKLENDGFLNAGAVTLFTHQNPELGMLNSPVSLKASYYFDIFQEPENYLVVQRKSENIDTYAVRLAELVDTTLQITERPKTNIIAFSMGGLVARRYIQIFGEDKVDKLILIGTPNKGITGTAATFCSIVGAELECADMRTDSLFMNKLSRQKFSIPVVNIYGTGCQMDEDLGDGVVLEKNAQLSEAENFVIEGKCERLNPLHTQLVNIEKFPEVYSIVKNALE